MNMSKITLKEVIQRTGKSESTIRRDMRSGKVSYSKNENGRVQFDTAELSRVYGQLKSDDTATDTATDREMNGHDTPIDGEKVITLLEGQVAALKTQLETANTEKAQLLELADRLQKQNEVLMLPPETQTKPTWWQRLTGK